MDERERKQREELASSVRAIITLLSNDEWAAGMETVRALEGMIRPDKNADIDSWLIDIEELNLGTRRISLEATLERGAAILRDLVTYNAPVRDYFVTFGQKYRHDVSHPTLVEGTRPHPDGWVKLRCLNRVQADRLADALFGSRYAFVYPEEVFRRDLYPMGELFCIEVGGSL